MAFKLLAAALIIGVALPAAAHSWYPIECCSQQEDCRQVKGEAAPGGFRFVDGDHVWYVNEADTRPSEDGFYHLCQPKGYAKPICFFAPRTGA